MRLNNDFERVSDELDLSLLSLLVSDRIESFKSKIPSMKIKLTQIFDKIIKTEVLEATFNFAPAKESSRALVKLLEEVKATNKFPIEKLKDIARGSF